MNQCYAYTLESASLVLGGAEPTVDVAQEINTQSIESKIVYVEH